MKININQDQIALEMYEAAERFGMEEPRRKYVGMSEIGGACSRKIWLKFRGVSGGRIPGQTIMLFSLGDRIEEEVIKWLEKAKYRISDRQLTFSGHNGFFRGHCDGIIHRVSSHPHILEIKSANDKSFKAFKKYGVREKSEQYYAQMQCYMGYSKKVRALFVVMNKNNSEIYTERIKFDRNYFQELDKKALEIIQSISIPPKTENSLCFFCEFKIQCESEEFMTYINHCPTCSFFSWGAPGRPFPICKHEKHPFEIKQCPPNHEWTSCQDYVNMFEKRYIQIGDERYPICRQ